jgi:hypothetical protein
MKKTFFEKIENIFSYKNLVILFIILLIFTIIYAYATQYTRTITIKKLTSYNYGKYGLNVRYLVIDENEKVYMISNSLYYLFFKSAELYANLEINHTYNIKGYGIRIPILGFYPIIIKATKITS